MLPPGRYRKITGNEALAIGLAAAAVQADTPMLYAGYPITPASDILHHLVGMKHYPVSCIQAEDEIAAAGMAIGAAFGGRLGVTATSGPGICLKSEAIGLAVMTELPLVVIDVQRGGPSTGLPTKTEQADLLAGDVRPQRRVPRGDRGALFAGRLFHDGPRGGAAGGRPS